MGLLDRFFKTYEKTEDLNVTKALSLVEEYTDELRAIDDCLAEYRKTNFIETEHLESITKELKNTSDVILQKELEQKVNIHKLEIGETHINIDVLTRQREDIKHLIHAILGTINI